MGTSKKVGYYELKYAESSEYKKHYSDSVYLESWKTIVKSYLHDCRRLRIVDIGCGPGQFANLLHDNDFKHYIGIDFSQTAITMAKGLNLKGYSFINMSINDIINQRFLKVVEYEIIIMLEVLEHLDGNLDLVLLKEIPSLTHIIFSVPNFDSASHERYFNNINEIMIRYGVYLSNIKIDTVPLNEKNKIFIVNARRSTMMV